MARPASFIATFMLCGLLAWTSGCTTSSSPTSPSSTAGTTKSASSETSTTTTSANIESEPNKSLVSSASSSYWEDYPDVPKVEIMSEINGIKIPRREAMGESLQLSGPLPVDVGNEHAAKKPSQPTTGDTLRIRFNSEPKLLNPILETSAVRAYILQYVAEPLARQDMETFEYHPHIASKWVIEDSAKLSPDYPGYERRIAIKGAATPAPVIEIEYKAAPPAADPKEIVEQPKVAVLTSNKEGQPVGGVWVGVYPIGKIPGASSIGYHFWSGPDGEAQITAIPSGKYTVKVGAEVFGKTQRADDKSITVTPGTDGNPLQSMLKSANESSLTLKPDQWIDLHEQTYFTYFLRDDVKWSDGTPFTTKDIEFTAAVIHNPTVDAAPLRAYYDDMIECREMGPHVVRMRYRQPYFQAFQYASEISKVGPPFHFFANIFKEEKGRELTMEELTPEQETAQKKISVHGKEFGKFFNTDDRYNRTPLGTGPYIIERWLNQDRAELVRNRDYWNPQRAGHLDRIVVKFIADQVSAMTALKAGEIDFLYRMTAGQYFEDWPSVDEARRNDFVKAEWYSPNFRFFAFNFLAPQLQDRRVRIAISLLFNKQEFIDTKMHGAATTVSGPQYYFGPGYDRTVPPLGYDPETARELLSDAGWIDTDNDGIIDRDGTKFQVEICLPEGDAVTAAQCEVLQKNLKSVGIELKIRPLEWASFISKIQAKEVDIINIGWAMDPEADPYSVWHSSGAGRHVRGHNAISFANPQADQLIEMLRVTPDLQKRKRIHSSFHRLVDSEQPYCFLWILKDLGVYHKRFRNVKWYRLRPGFDLSEWYVPKDEQTN